MATFNEADQAEIKRRDVSANAIHGAYEVRAVWRAGAEGFTSCALVDVAALGRLYDREPDGYSVYRFEERDGALTRIQSIVCDAPTLGGAADIARALDEADTMHNGRDGFARVMWSIDDLRGEGNEDVRVPASWTDAECAEWLDVNAGLIQDAMIAAGWDAIDTLLGDANVGDEDDESAEPEGAWCGRADHDADDCAREGCAL
ncbi:MAG: hypothetical protein WC211_03815 [Dehalococcoidia bacterium]